MIRGYLATLALIVALTLAGVGILAPGVLARASDNSSRGPDLLAPESLGPEVTIHLEASQFSYSPGVIRVQQGAQVHVELASHDVTHGLYLEEYAVSLQAVPGKPASADFVADRPGHYRFYCNTICGQLHPFMVGELVVEPSSFGSFPTGWPLYLGLGLLPLAAVVGVASGLRPALRPARAGLRPGTKVSPRWELTAWKPLQRLLRGRFLQQGVIAALLAGLTLAALAGVLGSPVGSHNFAIIFVWIVWWGILKLVLIPFGGRAWCAVCPLPAPGEWLQRRAVVSRGPLRALGLGRAWPSRLRGGWLATGTLLAIGVASAPILTRPALTGGFLAAMAALALGLAVVFRGRAFCRYVCPVGGFVGLYSLAAPVALRVKDPNICLHHKEKECLRGSATAYGCPWLAYPGVLSRNLDCGLCLECLRACPKDNVGIYLRPFGTDLVASLDGGDTTWPRADEGFGAVVMLALAAIYSAVFLGPWGELKTEALLATPLDAARHALVVVGGAALVAPLLWLGVAALARLAAGRSDVSLKKVWAGTAVTLVPLGLLAWVAFTVSFVLGSGTYVLSSVADPLGWGWNLFGLATPWTPLLPGIRPWLQLAAWLSGLAWAARVGLLAARQLFGEGRGSQRASIIIALGLALATGGLVWLGLG